MSATRRLPPYGPRTWRCEAGDGLVHLSLDPDLTHQGFMGSTFCERRVVDTIAGYETMRVPRGSNPADNRRVDCPECVALAAKLIARMNWSLTGEYPESYPDGGRS